MGHYDCKECHGYLDGHSLDCSRHENNQPKNTSSKYDKSPYFLYKLRTVNHERYSAWAQGTGDDPLYASNEFAGEAGEVCNEVKKLIRESKGWVGSRTTVDKLADEIGDAVICLDTIARMYGIDIEEAVTRKFNKTSIANNFPHRL